MHQKAGGRNAHLARVAELGRTGRLHRQGNVGVFGHDHRRMTAQLHGDALHVLASQCGQLLAHRRGAGEGDFADDGVGDQVVGDLSRCAVDQTQHTLRNACIGKGTDEGSGCGGCFFGGFDDHGATRRQGGSHFANHLVDGEVPWGESRHGAHGVFDDHLARRQVKARGHDAAVHAHAFIGKPLNDVGRGHGLALGFSQGLALLLGQHGRNIASTFAHQCCGLAHDFVALHWQHVAPGLKAFLGRLQGAVQVGDAGVGDTANFFAGGGVEHGQRFASGGVAPLAIDEELGMGVCHGGFLVKSGDFLPKMVCAHGPA